MGFIFAKPEPTRTQKEEKLLNEAKQYVEKNGFDGIREFYQDQIEKWDEFQFNVALVGSEGTGKLSSINALFGLPLFKKSPVPVAHPKNENIKVHDLRSSPNDSYLSSAFCTKTPSGDVFDAFLIFTESKISNEEKQLAEKISKNPDKPFCFIFTHIEHNKTLTEEEEANRLTQLKEDFFKNVKSLVKDEPEIYVFINQDTECPHEDVILKLVKRQKDLFLQSLKEAIYVYNKKTKEVFEEAQKHGVASVLDFYSSHLIPSWINAEINLAITGDSGTGKSSFVNAVRGLKDCEKRAAEVGVTETTLKPTAYSHPENKNIVFWDLPGIGTTTFPNLEEYSRKIGDLENYDAFLIFCKTRFTYYDKQLAEKVSKELKKPFFFVRTNVEYDLTNAKEDEGANYNEASVLIKMKKNCLKNLKGLINDEKDIYMIDNQFTEEYEFQRLKESIAEALPNEKKEKFFDCWPKLTSNLIKIKANFLRDQVSLVTVLFFIAESELEALVELVLKEVIRCHDVFGFHKNSKKSKEQLREEIKQELLKDEAVPESIGKVQLAYDYLINYINILEKDVLKAYDKKIRYSNNSTYV